MSDRTVNHSQKRHRKFRRAPSTVSTGLLLIVVLLATTLAVTVANEPTADAYCVGSTRYQYNGGNGEGDEVANVGTCNNNDLYGGVVRDNTMDGITAYYHYWPNGVKKTKTAHDSTSWVGYSTYDSNSSMSWESCKNVLYCSGVYSNSGF